MTQELPSLQALATPLDCFYPGGAPWLRRRLSDVQHQRASCAVAAKGGQILGAIIETPKGAERSKLSTIWVHPVARQRGVGSRLLEYLTVGWTNRGIEHGYVTVPNEIVNTLGPLLHRAGFVAEAIEPNRYRDGHDEHIYCWNMDRSAGLLTRPLAA